MKRFVVIATANRGAVDPHEPLDDAGQWLANMEAEASDLKDVDLLRRRATSGFQWERDPLPKPEEIARLTRRPKPERMDIERAFRGVA
jgi:hypothetical protein